MERIKRMAQEELRNFLALAKDGLRSGAYIYPFQVDHTVQSRPI